jgi:putative tryptophan/tyrosine transport system substrate-binding protein
VKSRKRHQSKKGSKVIDVIDLLLLVILLALYTTAEAQPRRKTVRLGYLANESVALNTPGQDEFFRALRAHDWIEGQNLLVERRYWENRRDRLSGIVNEIVGLKSDIVVTTTGTAALAAKRITSAIPIVMISSGDAVAQGLIASLARPGGNVTGLTALSPDTNERRMRLLKDAIPNLSSVAALVCSRRAPTNNLEWNELLAAAKALGLHLQRAEVDGPGQIELALRTATRQRAGALIVEDCTIIPSIETVELAAKFRLPAIYPSARFTVAGGVMAYGPDQVAMGRRAAEYVDKILNGAKPSELPVERPKKFEFVVNLKTAKQIGLTIPPNVLARADRVIR